jgi:signal transduction histidine kinase/CheY-like chemotaxis protein
MNLATAFAILSSVLACYVAQLSWRFSRAPGWSEQRYFSWVALCVAAYSGLNLATVSGWYGDAAVVACSRIQVSLAALHGVAWLRYSSAHLRLPRSRAERILVGALLAIAGLAVAVPIFHTGEVTHRAFAPLDVVYRDARATVLGNVAIALSLGSLAVPVARFARAWRAGVRNAGVQLGALSLLLLMGANDGLVQAGVYGAPYLTDLALLLPIVAVANALTARFVEDARALEALRQDLEREVRERTADLVQTQDRLHRAEKLAVLGQFAAGVAHEVNNPAAVVNANLRYLIDVEADALSDDGRSALDDSLVGVRRIAGIVRQLLDAGRLAAAAEKPHPVDLGAVVDEAMLAASARYGKRARATNRVPAGLHALAQDGVVLQVLSNLVVNATQAISETRRDGRIAIDGERDGDRVRITVEDNGSGIDPQTLRRVFEPFFTTKPAGSGTGLGLALSRGLVSGLGGDLRLESKPGVGTRAILELPAADAPATAPAGAKVTPLRRKLRLLVVDDDPAIRSSLRRMLEPRYGVEVAGDVDDGLRRLERERFDVVLCDVGMPDGGGERLCRTLEGVAPELAERVVLLTGGAADEHSDRFLQQQRRPVLYKPLDVEQLVRITDAI